MDKSQHASVGRSLTRGIVSAKNRSVRRKLRKPFKLLNLATLSQFVAGKSCYSCPFHDLQSFPNESVNALSQLLNKHVVEILSLAESKENLSTNVMSEIQMQLCDTAKRQHNFSNPTSKQLKRSSSPDTLSVQVDEIIEIEDSVVSNTTHIHKIPSLKYMFLSESDSSDGLVNVEETNFNESFYSVGHMSQLLKNVLSFSEENHSSSLPTPSGSGSSMFVQNIKPTTNVDLTNYGKSTICMVDDVIKIDMVIEEILQHMVTENYSHPLQNGSIHGHSPYYSSSQIDDSGLFSKSFMPLAVPSSSDNISDTVVSETDTLENQTFFNQPSVPSLTNEAFYNNLAKSQGTAAHGIGVASTSQMSDYNMDNGHPDDCEEHRRILTRDSSIPFPRDTSLSLRSGFDSLSEMNKLCNILHQTVSQSDFSEGMHKVLNEMSVSTMPNALRSDLNQAFCSEMDISHDKLSSMFTMEDEKLLSSSAEFSAMDLRDPGTYRRENQSLEHIDLQKLSLTGGSHSSNLHSGSSYPNVSMDLFSNSTSMANSENPGLDADASSDLINAPVSAPRDLNDQHMNMAFGAALNLFADSADLQTVGTGDLESFVASHPSLHFSGDMSASKAIDNVFMSDTAIPSWTGTPHSFNKNVMPQRIPNKQDLSSSTVTEKQNSLKSKRKQALKAMADDMTLESCENTKMFVAADPAHPSHCDQYEEQRRIPMESDMKVQWSISPSVSATINLAEQDQHKVRFSERSHLQPSECKLINANMTVSKSQLENVSVCVAKDSSRKSKESRSCVSFVSLDNKCKSSNLDIDCASTSGKDSCSLPFPEKALASDYFGPDKSKNKQVQNEVTSTERKGISRRKSKRKNVILNEDELFKQYGEDISKTKKKEVSSRKKSSTLLKEPTITTSTTLSNDDNLTIARLYSETVDECSGGAGQSATKLLDVSSGFRYFGMESVPSLWAKARHCFTKLKNHSDVEFLSCLESDEFTKFPEKRLRQGTVSSWYQFLWKLMSIHDSERVVERCQATILYSLNKHNFKYFPTTLEIMSILINAGIVDNLCPLPELYRQSKRQLQSNFKPLLSKSRQSVESKQGLPQKKLVLFRNLKYVIDTLNSAMEFIRISDLPYRTLSHLALIMAWLSCDTQIESPSIFIPLQCCLNNCVNFILEREWIKELNYLAHELVMLGKDHEGIIRLLDILSPSPRGCKLREAMCFAALHFLVNKTTYDQCLSAVSPLLVLQFLSSHELHKIPDENLLYGILVLAEKSLGELPDLSDENAVAVVDGLCDYLNMLKPKVSHTGCVRTLCIRIHHKLTWIKDMQIPQTMAYSNALTPSKQYTAHVNKQY